jgi:guanylate kinase
MKNEHTTPILLVISAPSGAGKTTLCRRLLQEFPRMRYSVSCTTRPPRKGEVDGVSYFFLSEEDFMRRREKGEFLEHAKVHGYWYGTLSETVEKNLAGGYDVLMDIDVQGAQTIRERLRRSGELETLRNAYVDVFIVPPSIEALEERLRLRAQDAEDVIQRRVHKATEEMRHWPAYDYVIVNDQLDHAYAQMHSVVCAEHARTKRVKLPR